MNGSSRFGLCLVNTSKTDAIFENASPYQPDYFPSGTTMDVLSQPNAPTLPWTFRLPIRGPKKASVEPMNHKAGLKQLTRTKFGISSSAMANGFIKSFQNSEQITFRVSEVPSLTLEFDNCHQGDSFDCPQLSLQLKY